MAEAYYEPTPATDGATMNPVPGAVFEVFEIADTAFATPLSLRVGSGNPTTTVTASETLATLPGVYVTSPNYEHIWKSGTFEWRRDSIDGAKKAIEDAKVAASNSASASDASAVAAANSAQAAQDAAALVDAPADTVMANLAGNPDSQFATQLSATYATKDNPAFTGTPTGITKAHVGLSNVENLSITSAVAPKLDKTEASAKYAVAPEVLLDPALVSGPVGARLTVPTHVSPAGGQTTHPSVVFVHHGWNGYRYWMAHTPYPAGNDDHEDPNICASNDGINWVVPAGLTNPIDDADGNPEYNSDVDLKFGPDNTLYLIWRHFDTNAVGTEEQLYYSTSTDGVTWAPKKLFMSSGQATQRLVSPSLVFEDGRWTMFAVDIAPSPNRMIMRRSETADLEGLWGAITPCNVGPLPTGKEPWHVFVIRDGGRYVALLNDCNTDASGVNGLLYFMYSVDGITWTRSAGTVIPQSQTNEHDALYRATMVPSFQDGSFGYRVWYSAWMNSSPAVWNVYRTWVGVPLGAKATASGEFSGITVAASGGFVSTAVSFPAGRFSAPPIVRVGTDNGRANLAYTEVTATGFKFNVNNWTSAGITTTAKFFWDAEEK